MNGPVICGIEDANDNSVVGVARGLAERFGLPLFFVHVLHGSEGTEKATTLLEEASTPGTGTLAIERGHPADRLVDVARDKEASFLVVGNHGPRSSLLGSISADVSRRASCPVVVVPPTAEAVAAAKGNTFDSGIGGGIARLSIDHAARRVT